MLPRYNFNSNATYLIAGGLGGLGRSIARWMAERKAKNLILLSRSGIQHEAARILLDELKAKGVNVAAPPCDVSDLQALSFTLAECSKTMPPIKGCIQASMVLKVRLPNETSEKQMLTLSQDAGFANMSVEQFNAAVKPKVDGSWNLHTLLPKGMDFFVLLASLSGVGGPYGQSNYASGNTYQDGLARYRVSRGEKAVSLDLGVLQSVGYVAERERLADLLQNQATQGIQESEFHSVLDYYCDPNLPLLSPLHSQVIIGLEIPARLRAKSVDEPSWMSRPLFKQLYQIYSHRTSAAQDAERAVNYEFLLRGAESLSEVAALIVDGLRTKLSKTLAMDKEDIDTNRPMHTYGVDSLAAVEVRTWFRRIIGADVTVFEILGNGSIASLGLSVAAKSEFVRAELKNVCED
jgi:KR domain/Phosphopantetheine attachment site